MAGYIGSKGSGIISGIDASIADLNLTDKASANGTTEANKVLTADGNKDVTAIRNLTATGTVTRALTRGSIDVGNSSGVSTPLAIGGANTLLQSDGTDASWATVSGSDSRQEFVADGTVGARAGVFLTVAGKVSASPAYLLSDYDQISDLGTVRNLQASAAYSGASGCTAFSTQDNKIVSVMKNIVYSTAINMQYMVSTLAADGTLSHGSLLDFNTSSFPYITAINMKYNAAINRFICWGGNGYGPGVSGVANTQQFIAIGTLNASNNTVAWTFSNVTSVGYYSGSYSSIPYSTRSCSFNYCPFDVATDGSHMATIAQGYFDNNGSALQTSMRAFSINASNNTASGGSWVTMKHANSNVIANYNGPYNVTWHNGTSQYILQVYGGNVYGINTSTYAAYNNTTVFWLATVSGNTISQVTTSSMLKTDGSGLSSGYSAPQNKDIVWVATDNANVLWGISGTMDYTNGIVLHRVTIGSGSLSSYSRSDVINLKDSQFGNISIVGDGIASCNTVNPLPVNGGTSSPKWLLNFLNTNISATGLLSTAKWSAEITYDSSTLGSVTYSEGNGVPSQPFDAPGVTQYYPSGGNCWAYDSNRNQAVGIGTTTTSDGTSTQKYITAVAVKTGDKGSLNNVIGLNDSSSSVSDGNTVTTAMMGSVVSGFSGLGIGSELLSSNGSTVGRAISATKVFVTADGSGGG
jgi:hypothetical protein